MKFCLLNGEPMEFPAQLRSLDLQLSRSVRSGHNALLAPINNSWKLPEIAGLAHLRKLKISFPKCSMPMDALLQLQQLEEIELDFVSFHRTQVDDLRRMPQLRVLKCANLSAAVLSGSRSRPISCSSCASSTAPCARMRIRRRWPARLCWPVWRWCT